MQVHGVGAGHGPHGGPPPQAAANRPQRSEASTPSGGVTPTSSHLGGPPAHGVRRLLEAGHFEGKNSYGPHVAKFGPPAYALVAETPVDEIPTDDTPIETLPLEDIVIEEGVVEAPPLEEPPTPDPALLDLDTLLMEELIAGQEEPPTLLETLETLIEDDPTAQPDEPPVTVEDDTTLLEEIVESIEENVEDPSA